MNADAKTSGEIEAAITRMTDAYIAHATSTISWHALRQIPT